MPHDPEPDDLPLPTADTSRRFPEDQMLRKAGYRIHSRPKRGPVLWWREGQTWTHREAVALCRAARRGM